MVQIGCSNPTKMLQMLKMVQNSNFPEKIEKMPENHIHYIMRSGKVSAYLGIWFVNKKLFKFLAEI
jgi:hypothetical protein